MAIRKRSPGDTEPANRRVVQRSKGESSLSCPLQLSLRQSFCWSFDRSIFYDLMLYVVKKNSKISCSSRTPFMHNNQKCARLVYIYIYTFNLHTYQMYQCLSSSSASTFKVHRTHGSTTIHTTELQAVHLSSLQTKAASSTTGTVKTAMWLAFSSTSFKLS